MNRSVNMVILIGIVGDEPEIKEISDTKKVATLRMATNRSWFDSVSNENKTETEWHTVTTYVGNLINIIGNFVHKGSKIYIKGRIKTNSWLDRNNEKRYQKKIVLDPYEGSLILLDKKNYSANESIKEDSDFSIDNDEIPF